MWFPTSQNHQLALLPTKLFVCAIFRFHFVSVNFNLVEDLAGERKVMVASFPFLLLLVTFGDTIYVCMLWSLFVTFSSKQRISLKNRKQKQQQKNIRNVCFCSSFVIAIVCSIVPQSDFKNLYRIVYKYHVKGIFSFLNLRPILHLRLDSSS